MQRISPSVQFVIRKAMAKDRDLRYATPPHWVEAVLDDFDGDSRIDAAVPRHGSPEKTQWDTAAVTP